MVIIFKWSIEHLCCWSVDDDEIWDGGAFWYYIFLDLDTACGQSPIQIVHSFAIVEWSRVFNVLPNVLAFDFYCPANRCKIWTTNGERWPAKKMLLTLGIEHQPESNWLQKPQENMVHLYVKCHPGSSSWGKLSATTSEQSDEKWEGKKKNSKKNPAPLFWLWLL